MVKRILKTIINEKRKKDLNKRIRIFETDNKEWLLNNKALNNSAQKEECVIVGNGPSIKDFDFDLLKGKDVFTVNQIARNKNFNRIDVKYHFWADPMFFYEDENHNKTISDDMYEQMLSVVRNNKNAKFFVVSDLNNGVVQSLIKEGAQVYRYPSFMETIPFYNDKKPLLDKACPGFYNVIQFAIYTAFAMGYKKIYLLGSEQTGLLTILNTKVNEKADENGYGYDINDEEKRRMISHYKKFSVALYLHQHAKMFDDFEWLETLANSLRVKIYNCTPHSLVDSFEKLSIKELLNNI